ncbi:hypothetical protein JOM56_006235 [Amanita muscaria]
MNSDFSCRFIDHLIPLVLESNDHWWPIDLANLCRASSAWLYFSRRVLYQCPHLTTFRACALFARSLKESASLRDLVKGVRLQPTTGYRDSIPAAYLDSLRIILGTDGLESIILGGDLAVATGRYLHLITNPGAVINLRIDGMPMLCAARHCPSLEWDETLALKFSRLRSLHLCNLVLDMDVDTSTSPCPSMLRTLVLENVELSFGRLTALVNEDTTLEHLHVTTEQGCEYNDDIREVLMSCEVHSLEYRVKHDCHSSEVSLFHNDMEPLPHLKRLHLEGVYVDRDMLECIGRLCRGLKELELRGRGVAVRPAEIAGVVGRS